MGEGRSVQFDVAVHTSERSCAIPACPRGFAFGATDSFATRRKEMEAEQRLSFLMGKH